MTDRLADETAEEREARLRKTTASNHARLAAEEREARLQSTGEAQTTTGHAGTAPIVSAIFYPN